MKIGRIGYNKAIKARSFQHEIQQTEYIVFSKESAWKAEAAGMSPQKGTGIRKYCEITIVNALGSDAQKGTSIRKTKVFLCQLLQEQKGTGIHML